MNLPEKVAVPLHAHVAVTLKDVASMTMLIKYCMELRGPTLPESSQAKATFPIQQHMFKGACMSAVLDWIVSFNFQLSLQLHYDPLQPRAGSRPLYSSSQVRHLFWKGRHGLLRHFLLLLDMLKRWQDWGKLKASWDISALDLALQTRVWSVFVTVYPNLYEQNMDI